jgi:hypothetical protein
MEKDRQKSNGHKTGKSNGNGNGNGNGRGLRKERRTGRVEWTGKINPKGEEREKAKVGKRIG